MGFWSVAGKAAKGVMGFVASETGAAIERNKLYNEEMPAKNDDELKKIFSKYLNSKPIMALAAGRELKNRGYSQEDLSQISRENSKR